MGERPLRILVVCTANQCRSPMAAAIAQHRFARIGVEAEVTSAGVDAVWGMSATENAELTMDRMGLDISEHQARHIDQASVESRDAIWCMERRHAVDIGLRWPSVIPVTYTLLDLEARTRHAHRHPSESLHHWLKRIGAERQPADLMGTSAPDDVADPIGRSLRQYRRTAERMSEAIDTILAALNPPLPTEDDGT